MTLRKETEEELALRMTQLGIKEEDLLEKFILGGGSGGQKINKSASCVYLKHLPSGIEVKCQQERSRELNRFFARRKLCDEIEKNILGLKTKKDLKLDKLKKQKKRRERKRKSKDDEKNTETL